MEDGNLLLIKSDGTSTPLHIDTDRTEFPSGLTAYQPHRAQHLFCNKCGIHVFSFSDVPDYGIYIGVNLLCLDLEKIGKDIKDVAEPSKVTYANGKSDTWSQRKGEPWPGGVW